MARAKGARAQMALAYETVYFASLGAFQEHLCAELTSYLLRRRPSQTSSAMPKPRLRKVASLQYAPGGWLICVPNGGDFGKHCCQARTTLWPMGSADLSGFSTSMMLPLRTSASPTSTAIVRLWCATPCARTRRSPPFRRSMPGTVPPACCRSGQRSRSLHPRAAGTMSCPPLICLRR